MERGFTLNEFQFLRYLMEDAGELIEDIIETLEEDDNASFYNDGTPNDALYKISNDTYEKLMLNGAQLGYVTLEDAHEAINERRNTLGD